MVAPLAINSGRGVVNVRLYSSAGRKRPVAVMTKRQMMPKMMTTATSRSKFEKREREREIERYIYIYIYIFIFIFIFILVFIYIYVCIYL